MKIKFILAQMSNVYKPQRQFFIVLMATLMCFRGKANFRNLSRYSNFNEKTYSRWFRRDFDFVEFNNISLAEISNNDNTLIATIDCFINKSGKRTYGLDKFYNGKQGKAENGIEDKVFLAKKLYPRTNYRNDVPHQSLMIDHQSLQ